MEKVTVLKSGEPCNHPGCAHHVTHPCEGCGRIACQGVVELPEYLLQGWKNQNEKDRKNGNKH